MSDLSAPIATISEIYAQCTIRGRRLTPTSSSLGWGLLGCSRVAGQQMLPAIRQQPPLPGQPHTASGWVAAVFSHNERRGQQFAELHQIPQAYTNLADLLARRDIQCVYVSSHPRHHAPLIMASLAAGKHVLCEPPLALSLEEAQAIEDLAANRGLLVGLNYTARANPAIQQLQRLLAEGEIGDLLGGRITFPKLLPLDQQTWRLQPNGGGVLWNHTIHDIDLTRYLCSDEVSYVYASSAQRLFNPQSRVEEDLLAHLTLRRSKLTIQVHDSFWLGHQPAVAEFYGTQGVLFVTRWPDAETRTELGLRRRHHVEQLTVPMVAPFWLMIYQFQDAVHQEWKPFATVLDGLQGVAVALALEKALRERTPTRVNPTPPV